MFSFSLSCIYEIKCPVSFTNNFTIVRIIEREFNMMQILNREKHRFIHKLHFFVEYSLKA